MKKKQILIFGGSFNPPLNSHFSLAEQVINEYNNIEKIVFVPVNSKYQKVGLISNEHRYQMLKVVCDKNDKSEVSRIEIDNNIPLYTVETLREFQRIYSKYEIAFIIESDNITRNLSSTFVRENIKKGKSIRYLAPDEVVSYIVENKLYQ